jgi:type VI secretion system protein ImpM
MFFAAGGTTPSLRLEITPTDLDAGAKQVTLDLGGSSLTYAHGPSRAVAVNWPAQGGSEARLAFDPPTPGGAIQASGPWALFHLIAQGTLQPNGAPDRFTLVFQHGDRRAVFGAQPVQQHGVAGLPVSRPAMNAFSLGGEPLTGLYGKLPARGDFVRAGLRRRFTDPWDAWLQDAMRSGRALLEEDFVPAWLEAPVWRFALAAGLCGPAVGVWMPSTDRSGRHFPLTIARVGTAVAIGVAAQAFLDTAEDAGLAAVADDLGPEDIIAWLHTAPAPLTDTADADLQTPSEGTLWWTVGAPRHAACTLRLPGLPDGETFALMLDEEAACR